MRDYHLKRKTLLGGCKMTDISNEIFIVTRVSQQSDDIKIESRRGAVRSGLQAQILNVESVDVNHFQNQVNIFINSMDKIMKEIPEKVGDFKLDQLEVSAAITLQGKGEIKLALIGGELSAGINAGLKFVFKRS